MCILPSRGIGGIVDNICGEWVKGLGENALNTTKCGRTLLLVGGTRLRAGHEGGDGGDRSNNAKTAPIFLRGGCGVVVSGVQRHTLIVV